jgi:hypothetical protein
MLTGCSTAREAGCVASLKGFVALDAEEEEERGECAMAAVSQRMRKKEKDRS